MEGERVERIALRENIVGQGLILTTLALMCLGAVMVFSATAPGPSIAAWYEQTCFRQPIFAAAGMLLLCGLWRVDYHRLTRRPWPGRRMLGWIPSPAVVLMLVGAASAAFALMAGHSVGGFRRWIRMGPVGFQPSEVLKIALPLVLAGLLSRSDVSPRSFRRTFLPAIALIGLSVALVIKDDFGTAAIIGIAAVAVLLVGGIRWHYVPALMPLCALGFFVFVVCVPHRWGRIEAWIHPSDETNRATYHSRQSEIAIGSGIEPAGLGGGVAKYGYVPEIRTDFIFTHIVEELGRPGVGLVVGLMLVWLLLAAQAAAHAADRLGALLAGGLGFLIAFQGALHLAVNLRSAPPTGVSLPFVSAGGSSLLLLSFASAVIVSVSSRPSSELCDPVAAQPADAG